MKKLFKSDKASVGMVIALIVTVAVLVIGVYLLATFQGAMPTVTDETANDTMFAILDAGWSAFGLAVIIPIVVVAGAVIGYLVRGFGGSTR